MSDSIDLDMSIRVVSELIYDGMDSAKDDILISKKKLNCDNKLVIEAKLVTDRNMGEETGNTLDTDLVSKFIINRYVYDCYRLLQYHEVRTIIMLCLGVVMIIMGTTAIYRVLHRLIPALVCGLFICKFVLTHLRMFAQGPSLCLEDKTVKKKLSDKTIVITGGGSGIGLEVVTLLCELETKKVIVCMKRGEERLTYIKECVRKKISSQDLKTEIVSLELDLDNKESVNKCCEFLSKETIDCFVCNAGIITEDGNAAMRVNWLNHCRIIDEIKANCKKIVTLSSIMHGLGFMGEKIEPNYSSSKLGMLLEAEYIYKTYGIESCSIHPGWVKTKMTNYDLISGQLSSLLGKEPRMGAMMVVKGVLDGCKGRYYQCMKECKSFSSENVSKKYYVEIRNNELTKLGDTK